MKEPKDREARVLSTLAPPPILHFAFSEQASADLAERLKHRLWIFRHLVTPGTVYMLSSSECDATDVAVYLHTESGRLPVPKQNLVAWHEAGYNRTLFADMQAWERAGAVVHPYDSSGYLAWAAENHGIQMKMLQETL